MVDLVKPNAPKIEIEILANGQIKMNFPPDKMLALSMLSLARAMVERDILGGVHSLATGVAGGSH